MTQWIQNVSKEDIRVGRHFDCGENSMLIAMLDPLEAFPRPYHTFKEVHQFEFHDVETEVTDFVAISDEDAATIAALLKRALADKMQVVAHCHAGLCRSGAVAEVGIMMGFTDTDAVRMPNCLVKKKLLKALGMEDHPRTFENFVANEDGLFLPSGYGG